MRNALKINSSKLETWKSANFSSALSMVSIADKAVLPKSHDAHAIRPDEIPLLNTLQHACHDTLKCLELLVEASSKIS